MTIWQVAYVFRPYSARIRLSIRKKKLRFKFIFPLFKFRRRTSYPAADFWRAVVEDEGGSRDGRSLRVVSGRRRRRVVGCGRRGERNFAQEVEEEKGWCRWWWYGSSFSSLLFFFTPSSSSFFFFPLLLLLTCQPSLKKTPPFFFLLLFLFPLHSSKFCQMAN